MKDLVQLDAKLETMSKSAVRATADSGAVLQRKYEEKIGREHLENLIEDHYIVMGVPLAKRV